MFGRKYLSLGIETLINTFIVGMHRYTEDMLFFQKRLKFESSTVGVVLFSTTVIKEMVLQ